MNKQNVRNIVVIVVTTALILGGLWLVKTLRDGGSPGSGVATVDISMAPGQSAPVVGQVAPDFTATTIDGQQISLSGLRGQPVWLIFGATWCTDCRVEAPDVQAVAQAYQGRVKVVAVYVGESTSTVEGYAQRIGLTYSQIADTPDTIAESYAVLGIPSHFFIDADGVIRQINVGAITQQGAKDALDALL